jgi:hypothetical protein
MRSKSACILFVSIMCGVPVVLTEAFGEEPRVICPSKSCPCKTVKVHTCDAKSDGTLYNCRDEDETECTITSGPGSGKPIKVKPK